MTEQERGRGQGATPDEGGVPLIPVEEDRISAPLGDEAVDAGAAGAGSPEAPVDDEPVEEAGDDELAAEDEVAAETGTAAPAVTRPGRTPRRGARQPAPAHAQTPSEKAVHIDDRVSKVFVILVVAVFVGIYLYALLFGLGGFLTTGPTATPAPSPVATASP
jgi:hypothetical protein